MQMKIIFLAPLIYLQLLPIKYFSVHFDLFSIVSAYCLIFSFVHGSGFLVIFSLNLSVKKTANSI